MVRGDYDKFKKSVTQDSYPVAIAASHQESKFGSENVETDGAWEPMEAEDGSEAFGAPEIEQRDYSITRERTGLVANFDLRLSETSLLYLHSLYSDFSADGNRVIESGESIPGAEEIAEDVYVSAENYESDYSHLFPRVNFKYDYTDNIVLRAAYTESLSRPQL